MDFSFENTRISNFFNGNNEDPPISELIYLHTHPLIRPNFLVELEALVVQTGNMLKTKKMTGYPVQEMIRIAAQIGKTLPIIDENNALDILKEMRNLYALCVSLLKNK